MKQNKPRDFMWVGSKIFDLYSIFGNSVKLVIEDLQDFKVWTIYYDEPIKGCIISRPNVDDPWFGKPVKFGRSEAIYDFVHNIMDNRDDPGWFDVGECDYLSSYLLACWCDRVLKSDKVKYFDLLVHDYTLYLTGKAYGSVPKGYTEENCDKVLGCHINLNDCFLLAITKRKDNSKYSLSGQDFPHPIQDFIDALCLFMET